MRRLRLALQQNPPIVHHVYGHYVVQSPVGVDKDTTHSLAVHHENIARGGQSLAAAAAPCSDSEGKRERERK